MNHLQLNGHQIQGQIYSLDLKNTSLHQLAEKAENDGLDQVFFEAGGQAYVLEGDGLDLSVLKNKSFIQGELSLNGQLIPANHLIIDNEVNTASEGLSMVGKGALGLALGALGVGSAVSYSGVRSIQAGQALSKVGSETLQEGAKRLSSHLVNARSTVNMALSQQAFAKQASGLSDKMIQKLFKGKRPNANWPTDLSQIKVPPKVANDLGMKELGQAESGLAQMNKGASQITKGNQTLKTGLKIVAIGAAVVGTVAAGGALYGAFRGADEERLSDFKKEIGTAATGSVPTGLGNAVGLNVYLDSASK